MLEGVLRVAGVRFEGVDAGRGDEAPAADLSRLAERLRGAYADLAIGSIPGVQEARALFRALGIDPTRTRPSSEALLRRALKGLPMPRVNAAVDAANCVSLERLLPVGLYDAGRIQGGVVVRLGRPGEGFAGIRKERVNLEGRIALCDDLGPFGNPTSDSDRTKVTAATKSLLFVLFAPLSVAPAALRAGLAAAADRFERSVGGRASESWVLPPAPDV